MPVGSIYQRKDGYWVGAVQVDGKRRVVYGKTEAQAKKKLAALQQQVAQVGGLPDAGRRTRAGESTVLGGLAAPTPPSLRRHGDD